MIKVRGKVVVIQNRTFRRVVCFLAKTSATVAQKVNKVSVIEVNVTM